MVYVSAHTWDDRMTGEDCAGRTSRTKYSYLSAAPLPYRYMFTDDVSAAGFQMSAGQTVRFTTEWNFADEGTIPDWSVVAWAPNGGLSITHEGGWTSDSLPVLGAASNDDTTPADDDTTPADDDTTPADDDTTPVDPVDPVPDPEPIVDPVDEDWEAWMKINDDLRDYVNAYEVADCSIVLSNGWY